MAKGVKTGGRQKGTPNKFSGNVKDAVWETFNRMGGVDDMHSWARENRTEFYKIMSRLIPVEHSGEGGGPIKFELVAPWLRAAIQTRNQ